MPIFTSYVSSSGDAPAAYGSTYDGADPKAGEMTGSLHIGHSTTVGSSNASGSLTVAGFGAAGGHGNRHLLYADVSVPEYYNVLLIGDDTHGIRVHTGYTLSIATNSTVIIKNVAAI
tara:strand:- start:1218 stop:1568 length:351 start_codon:yes stop_codon:yes gene_type:complete